MEQEPSAMAESRIGPRTANGGCYQMSWFIHIRNGGIDAAT
jgi:hypothetical protein